MYLPIENFVTPQAVSSQTFKPPPLDGSMCLAQMIDFHGQYSKTHTWATYHQDGIIKHVSWKMFHTAVHRVAKMLYEKVPESRHGGKTFAVLVNRDTMSYISLVAGIIRTGNTAFLISPKNSLPSVTHLLESTKSIAIVCTNETNEKNLVDGVLKVLPRNIYKINAPLFTQVFDYNDNSETSNFEYLPKMNTPHGDESCLIIHSSGSTAFPKPIPISQTGILQWARMPWYSYIDFCGHSYGIQAAPPYHTMGIMVGLAQPCSSGYNISVFQPRDPPIIPSPERIIESYSLTNTTIAESPPHNAIQWIKDEKAIKVLSNLSLLRLGSGPCPKAVGDYLVQQNVPLINIYGTTESGVVTCPRHKELFEDDWEYIEISRMANPIFRPVETDSGEFYEICFPSTPTHTPSVFTDKVNNIYETNDMVQLHPTRPGLFKVVGRVDDQIMLSTGEKTNPGPMESIIRGDKMVKQAIYFGRERFNNGVLIEPAAGFEIDVNNDSHVSAFRNSIWPTIQQANDVAPAHSRVYKEMLLIASQDKQFLLTPKGTVARPRTLDLYDDEINSIYKRAEESSEDDVPFPSNDDLNYMQVYRYLLNVVTKVMRPNGGDIDGNNDLFDQGCDSLQATIIKNRVSSTLRKAQHQTRSIQQNWVYVNPNIDLLCQSIMEILRGKSDNGKFQDKNGPDLEQVAKDFCVNFPKHSGTKEIPSKRCIIITGTTGNLGCYLLDEFNNDPSVSKIYAINRPSPTSKKTLKKRQEDALIDRGLDVNCLNNTSRICLIEADLARPDFGIGQNMYKELQNTVTSIIHNAWKLDFNLGLNSFMPSIQGVRNMVNFALGSPFIKLPTIINTSSMSVVDMNPNGWAEEQKAIVDHVASSGYGQSKFVSERILEITNKETGLPVINTRIGQLCGSQRNGAWNKSDWFPLIVKSAEELGILPDGHGPVAWVPIDKTAQIINDFSKSSNQQVTLHVAHPNTVSWDTIISQIAKKLGAKIVSSKEWIEALEKANDVEKNPAIKLFEFYQYKIKCMDTADKDYLSGREAFGLPRLKTPKSELASETLSTLDPINSDSVNTWIQYWANIGFLKV